MHVVAATPLYPPKSRVGAWLSTHECLAHLVERGHSVEVITAFALGDYELDGVNVFGQNTKLVDRIADADVVVSHLGDKGEAAALAIKHGKPSVRMVHGESTGMADKLAGSALAVFNAQYISTCGWQGASVVVHPPVDLELHRTTPGDHVTLVNLAPEKGGLLFKRIAAAMPDLKFLGVKGGYGAQRLHGRSNLEVIGVTTDMRADVWSRTRILVMPSERETWGRVAVEAMASGIPVVAHPTPGLLESLGDAGIFADRSDLSAWVAELTRLQDPDEWAEASSRALARASQFDHRADLNRFANAVEALVQVPA